MTGVRFEGRAIFLHKIATKTQRKENMSAQENVETVKKFFAALGGGDKQGLLALSAEDIEWIIPGEGWPLAGTHRGTRGIGRSASEGFRNGGNFIPDAL